MSDILLAQEMNKNAALERRIEELESEVRQAIGWMYAYACTCVDEGVDIRQMDLPEIAEECIPTIRKAREEKQ